MSSNLQVELPNGESLDLRAAPLLAPAEAALAEVLADVALATQQALENPLDFPALKFSLTPGDCVAIAVGEGVPEVVAVVTGMMQALAAAGVQGHEVSIVTASQADYDRLTEANREISAGAAQLFQHDPSDEAGLCFVGLMKPMQELKLNRQLCEADVVLPVSCVYAPEDLDSRGVYDGLYPAFSNEETLLRFRRETLEHGDRDRPRQQSQTEQAGWLLGAQLVTQVVPGPRGAVGGVLAGEPHAVRAAALARRAQLWRRTTPARADLVIAVLGGDSDQQTWRNVGRALAAAQRVVAEGGAIALCTQLAEPVGRSVGRLMGAEDLERVAKKIASDAAADSLIAHTLLTAINQGPVYLMSQLEDDLVEELGLAPLHSTAELTRLAARRKSCLLLADAQQLDVCLAG